MTEQATSSIDLFWQKWATGGFPNQRMGQAFCNHLDIHDPELFYTTDVVKAKTKIYEYTEKWQLHVK